MNFSSLKGKTAIVTGGSSELDQAFAVALTKISANVFTPSFVKDNGETGEMIEKQDAEVDFVQVDITTEDILQKIITVCCERFGTVDALADNVGICKLNKMPGFGRADWDPTIDVNFAAASESDHEAAETMVPQKGGKIINICSLFSYLDGQWSPTCSATKHALAEFTKTYCDELGQYSIQVNGTSPGYYATDITLATRSNPKTNQRALDYILINRWGNTQGLMGTAVLLANSASDYINGHLSMVDSGYLVR